MRRSAQKRAPAKPSRPSLLRRAYRWTVGPKPLTKRQRQKLFKRREQIYKDLDDLQQKWGRLGEAPEEHGTVKFIGKYGRAQRGRPVHQGTIIDRHRRGMQFQIRQKGKELQKVEGDLHGDFWSRVRRRGTQAAAAGSLLALGAGATPAGKRFLGRGLMKLTSPLLKVRQAARHAEGTLNRAFIRGLRRIGEEKLTPVLMAKHDAFYAKHLLGGGIPEYSATHFIDPKRMLSLRHAAKLSTKEGLAAMQAASNAEAIRQPTIERWGAAAFEKVGKLLNKIPALRRLLKFTRFDVYRGTRSAESKALGRAQFETSASKEAGRAMAGKGRFESAIKTRAGYRIPRGATIQWPERVGSRHRPPKTPKLRGLGHVRDAPRGPHRTFPTSSRIHLDKQDKRFWRDYQRGMSIKDLGLKYKMGPTLTSHTIERLNKANRVFRDLTWTEERGWHTAGSLPPGEKPTPFVGPPKPKQTHGQYMAERERKAKWERDREAKEAAERGGDIRKRY